MLKILLVLAAAGLVASLSYNYHQHQVLTARARDMLMLDILMEKQALEAQSVEADYVALLDICISEGRRAVGNDVRGPKWRSRNSKQMDEDSAYDERSDRS